MPDRFDAIVASEVPWRSRRDIRERGRLGPTLPAKRLIATRGGRPAVDFLAQELNREANTLCSKSNDVELTNIGLSSKAVSNSASRQNLSDELESA
jgi:uncharacterized protein YicC (UPF0701 family)